jgi:hypothetical protein
MFWEFLARTIVIARSCGTTGAGVCIKGLLWGRRRGRPWGGNVVGELVSS